MKKAKERFAARDARLDTPPAAEPLIRAYEGHGGTARRAEAQPSRHRRGMEKLAEPRPERRMCPAKTFLDGHHELGSRKALTPQRVADGVE